MVSLLSPPVNALHPTVLDALFAQLRKAQADPGVKAIVLTGSAGKFSAGFDIAVFGTPSFEEGFLRGDGGQRGEALKALATLLESGQKPTVAAIAGPCLGGGAELAMACNARVCTADARLGLPEVRLGLLPGLGGTQRLPRLVGVPKAVSMMLSGSPVSAAEGLELGLVDLVVGSAGAAEKAEAAEGELLAAAQALALELAAGRVPRRRTLHLTKHMQSSGDEFIAAATCLRDAQAREVRAHPGQLHTLLLLEAVAAGLAQGAPSGLQKEGEGFRQAARQALHRQLVWAFKAQRRLRKLPGGALLAKVFVLVAMLYISIYSWVVGKYRTFLVGYYKARSRPGSKALEQAGLAAAVSGDGRGSSSSSSNNNSRRRK